MSLLVTDMSWITILAFSFVMTLVLVSNNGMFEIVKMNENDIVSAKQQGSQEFPPFVHALQSLARCTDERQVVLSDTLKAQSECSTTMWQHCLHIHVHELTSLQVELKTRFPCHFGWFDVSRIQSLYHSIHVSPIFQVCQTSICILRIWYFSVELHWRCFSWQK